MKRFNSRGSLTALWLILLITPYTHAQHVLYGEHNPNKQNLCLYFDKEGNPYPDFFIADSSLQRANHSLREWYVQHPEQFQQIGIKYGLAPNLDAQSKSAQLHQKIIDQFLISLQPLKDSFSSITYVIHGFRKSFKKQAPDFSSAEDFADFKHAYSQAQTKKSLVVEVYWDGLYDCCVSHNVRKNKEIFQLFERAQSHAIQTGNSLRAYFVRSPFHHINVIGHSLGAMVAAQSCFNYAPTDEALPTDKRINICIIAPAMSGISAFSKYYSRNTDLSAPAQENYRLAIAYNQNDFVLKKRKRIAFIPLGPGPYKYGNTTLGCNHKNEALRLKKYFAEHFPKSPIELIDLSDAGACHNLRNTCYCQEFIMKRIVQFCEIQ